MGIFPCRIGTNPAKTAKRARQFCPTTPAQIPQQTHDHQRQLYPCPTKRPALENAKPFETTLRVRSDGIMQWNGSQWVNPNASKLNGQSRQIKLFLDLLGGNTQGLEKQFDLKLNGNEKKWTLTLTPKTAITRQIFNRIEINGDTLVRKIELDEKQGDKTIMQFNQIQTDKALDSFSRTAL